MKVPTNSPAGAVISKCERYRFALWRYFEIGIFARDRAGLLFVMNNPSTADGTVDDPTIRRVCGFAKRWGYKTVYVVNVNPTRSTDPRLATVPPESILKVNDEWIELLSAEADLVIAAWGLGAAPSLVERAVRILTRTHDIHVLGLTRSGAPRHPLYMPKGADPAPWKDRTA